MFYLLIALEFLSIFSENNQPKFEEQILDDKISIGYGLALGDVDGDGKPDILLADKKQFVWYRNGDWKKFVMVEDLTTHDNVCITARDVTGDGKVEVAVGAQWNPSETGNQAQSGSVHYLIRPADPTERWKAVTLPHEPTVHRMRWVKSSEGKYYLVVLPLHGRGNKGGEGEGVKLIAYEYPENVSGEWTTYPLQTNMHLTHNFHFTEGVTDSKAVLFVAGKEGIMYVQEEDFDESSQKQPTKLPGMQYPAGEVRAGKTASNKNFFVTIEPMHGEKVVVYPKDDGSERFVIDGDVKEGHALAAADFLGIGSDQVVAGWRMPNKDGKSGIKLYVRKDQEGKQWQSHWIDENKMACEDLQVMDLNADGRPDIIASGRSTKNLKIYWNKSSGNNN